MSSTPTVVEINPTRFYLVVDLIQKEQEDLARQAAFKSLKHSFDQQAEKVSDEIEVIRKVEVSITQESRLNTRKKKPSTMEFDTEDYNSFEGNYSRLNFIALINQVAGFLGVSFNSVQRLLRDLEPGPLILTKGKRFTESPDSFTEMQHMAYELQMNKPTVESYVTSLVDVRDLQHGLIQSVWSLTVALDQYRQILVDRHSTQGLKIHRDPVLTDIAMFIYENVDANGEIEVGTNPSEISAYSMKKAKTLTEALQNGVLFSIIENPASFTDFIVGNLKILWGITQKLHYHFEDNLRVLDRIAPSKRLYSQLDINLKYEFDDLLETIQDLDPSTIVFKKSNKLLSKEEQFSSNFKNETLEKVVGLILAEPFTPNAVIQYILERKSYLRKYFLEENSFYTCKISSGNPFSGEAPGGLSVVPSEKPYANLDKVVGGGFNDVKEFIQSVEASSKWHDLFLATSPSGTTDKANVLLLGPPGVGKSMCFKAIGADPNSISIFAQGSDFLTCWSGEAQKNPKRLFEAGLKLHKESGKRVNFLIDEIDAVLNNDRSSTSTNLTTEFQILMDGVVQYPGLCVWGATNYFERIPMAMVRRFNKVVLVGELNLEDRKKLLKQYLNFLPLRNFTNDVWDNLAAKLDGVTGDIIRKIADHLWRSKMTHFTKSNAGVAESLVSFLNEEKVFCLTDFDNKKREEFKILLAPFVCVTPEDVNTTVELHLNNQAILHDIYTAVSTYEKAKSFLSQLKEATN